MQNKIVNNLGVGLILLAVLISGSVLKERLQAESRNKNVELIMGLDDIQRLAALDGSSLAAGLQKLTQAGITSVALPEDNLATLEARGEISWQADPADSLVSSSNPALLQRIYTELVLSLGKGRVKLNHNLQIRDDKIELESLGVGFSAVTADYIRKAGFQIIPRLINNPRLSSAQFEKKLKFVKNLGEIKTIIFMADEVFGYPFNLPAVAAALLKHQLNFGIIEFSKQKGEEILASKMGSHLSRVHSISEEEMREKMLPSQAVNRFSRAVTDRGIRLLYIRPFYRPLPGQTILATNLNYIEQIKQQILKAGCYPGPQQGLGETKVAFWKITLVSLGLAAAFIWFVSFFTTVSVRVAYLILGLALLISLISPWLGALILWKKILALGSALIFPPLGILTAFPLKSKSPKFASLSTCILKLFILAGILSIGILFISAVLGDSSFRLGSQKFSGIKLAFLLPPLILAGYYYFAVSKQSFKSWLRTPITFGYALLAVSIAVLGLVYILRSGNFMLGVFDSEKMFRNLIEHLLIIRPRTKEFLFGYPLLMLGAFYYLKGGRKWLWLLLTLGSLGPVSTLNTFCHIHAPFLTSVLRSIYGLLLGIAVGLILIGLSVSLLFLKRKLNL